MSQQKLLFLPDGGERFYLLGASPRSWAFFGVLLVLLRAYVFLIWRGVRVAHDLPGQHLWQQLMATGVTAHDRGTGGHQRGGVVTGSIPAHRADAAVYLRRHELIDAVYGFHRHSVEYIPVFHAQLMQTHQSAIMGIGYFEKQWRCILCPI